MDEIGAALEEFGIPYLVACAGFTEDARGERPHAPVARAGRTRWTR